MALKEMKDLLTHELGDIYYAEQRILTMLRKLSSEVQAPEIRNRVEQHHTETEGQVERLKQAFEAIGEKARAEKCPGIIGLREEHDSFKREERPSKAMLEAFDLGSGLRMEHYEIAAYRSAIAVATALGEDACVELLKENLAEEEAMATFLEQNAVAALRKLDEQATN